MSDEQDAADGEYDYERPEQGAADWHEPLNRNFARLERDLGDLAERVRSLEADSGSKPGTGAPTPSPATGLPDGAVLERAYNPFVLTRDYRRSVDRPTDPDDPDALVLEPGDDLEAQLNREDRRLFFLTPGDYTDGSAPGDPIDLHTAGTEGAPRYVRWYDPEDPADDRHPWDQGEETRATLGHVAVRGADWWRFDRLEFTHRFEVYDSEHVLLDRMLYHEGVPAPDGSAGSAIKFSGGASGCDYATVQDSVVGRTYQPDWDAVADRSLDHNCIGIRNSDYVRVVGNELFDPFRGDGIQFWEPEQPCKRAIVQGNHVYLTAAYEEAYAERFDGDPAPVENAVDLKAGGADPESGSTDHLAPEEWTLVEGNRCWGRGMDLIFHHPPVGGVVVRHNVVWDTGEFAYRVSAKAERNEEHHVYDNVLFNTGRAFKPRHVDDSLYARNVVVRAGTAGSDPGWGWFAGPERNRVTHNVFVDADVDAPQRTEGGNVVEANAYYDSRPFHGSEPGRITRRSAVEARHEDVVLEVRPITGPEYVTIPMAGVTPESPHASWFGQG